MIVLIGVPQFTAGTDAAVLAVAQGEDDLVVINLKKVNDKRMTSKVLLGENAKVALPLEASIEPNVVNCFSSFCRHSGTRLVHRQMAWVRATTNTAEYIASQKSF
jgi:hypothetical protein